MEILLSYPIQVTMSIRRAQIESLSLYIINTPTNNLFAPVYFFFFIFSNKNYMWKDKNILFFFNPTPIWNLNSPSPFSSLFFLLSFPFLPLHEVQYFPSSNFIFKILREGKPWPPVEGKGKLEEREGQDRRITISVWCEG